MQLIGIDETTQSHGQRFRPVPAASGKPQGDELRPARGRLRRPRPPGRARRASSERRWRDAGWQLPPRAWPEIEGFQQQMSIRSRSKPAATDAAGRRPIPSPSHPFAGRSEPSSTPPSSSTPARCWASPWPVSATAERRRPVSGPAGRRRQADASAPPASRPRTTSDTFTVVDFYESKMSEYDSQLRLRADPQAAGAARHDRSDHRRRAGQRDPDQAQAGRRRRRGPRQARGRPFRPNSTSSTPGATSRGRCWPPCDMETAILNVLLFLIIAVAGFGILAIFFMIVVEKTRDIGILKSLGASSRGVMGIFLGYGLSLGLVGSGVGMVLGLLFVHYINEIADLLGWITGQPVFDPSIYYFYKIPAIVDAVDGGLDRRRGAWRSPCWPAFCRPAAPPGCIPWRHCAMSNSTREADERLDRSRLGARDSAGSDSVTELPSGADVQPVPAAPHPRIPEPRCRPTADDRPAQELSQGAGRGARAAGREPGVRRGRVPGDRRPERLGQEHAAAPAGHARRARPGRNPLRRPADRQPARGRAATSCGTSISA